MKIETDNPTAEFTLNFDDEEVGITVEFHFSDNAEEFIDVQSFVSAAASNLLSAMR